MRLTKRRSATSIPGSQSTTSLSDPTIPPPSLPLALASSTDVTTSTSHKGKHKNQSDNQYPPSSFTAGHGWSFSRLRSFKGKGKGTPAIDGSADAETHSAYDAKESASSHRTTDTIPNTNVSITSSLRSTDGRALFISSLPTPSSTSLLPSTLSSPLVGGCTPSHFQPMIATTPKIPHLAPISTVAVIDHDELAPLAAPRPMFHTSLSTASSIPSVDSGSSSMPLSPRTDDGQPHRRVVQVSSAANKLTKRRPVSTMYEQLELTECGSSATNPGQDRSRSGPFGQIPSAAQFFPISTDSMSSAVLALPILTLPDGAAPPHHHAQADYLLSRNPSSSTASASSGASPPTDESAMIETPLEAGIMQPTHTNGANFWGSLDIPRPTLSRSSSTRSYLVGDDGGVMPYDQPVNGAIKWNDTSTRDEGSAISLQDSPSLHVHHPTKRAVSPTHSTVLSTVTNTPTISTSSTATTRGAQRLEIPTSHLQPDDCHMQRDANHEEGEISIPDTGKRKSVAFEVVDLPYSSQDLSTSIAKPRSGARSSRPLLIRERSSSLGAMSVVTNHSIGEVNTAMNGFVSIARSVQLSASANQRERPRTGTITDLVNGLMDTGESMQRVFGPGGGSDWLEIDFFGHTFPRHSTSSHGKNRSKALSVRRAPPPPHLDHPTSPIPRIPHSAPAPDPPYPVSPLSPVASLESLIVATSYEEATTKRPSLPGRSGSLRKLWRTISGGSTLSSKKQKQKPGRAEFQAAGSDSEFGPPPVPQVKKYETYTGDSPTPHPTWKKRKVPMGPIDPMIPEVVCPQRPSEMFLGNEREAGQRQEHPSILRRRGEYTKSSEATPRWEFDGTQSVAVSLTQESHVINAREMSGVATQSNNRDSAAISSPVVASSSWRSPLGAFTPPLTALMDNYFHDLHIRTSGEQNASSLLTHEQMHRRPSLHEQAELQSHETRRKYRQTLIEITDDHVFQQVLEEFARLEIDPRVRLARGGGLALRDQAVEGVTGGDAVPAPCRTRSRELLDHKQRKHEMGGMFVVREMLFGERRYGRLLDRGIQMLKAVCGSHATTLSIPPFPTSQSDPMPISRAVKHQRSSSANLKSPSRLRRPRTAPPSSERPPQTAPCTPMTSHVSLRPPPLPLADSALPNVIGATREEALHQLSSLLGRMSGLVELSLKLSARLEHDPNPYSAAQAFIEMEGDLTTGIAGWASQIGEIIASGLGDAVGRLTSLQQKGGSVEHVERAWFDSDRRLTFSDILISPIQRGLRYHLQFKDLASKTVTGTNTAMKVEAAVSAALRLAEECNKSQKLDIEQLRRLGGDGKKDMDKGKRARPLTMVV